MLSNALAEKNTLDIRVRAIGINNNLSNSRYAVTGRQINNYERPSRSTGFIDDFTAAPLFFNKTGYYEGEMYGNGDAYALWSSEVDAYYKKYMPINDFHGSNRCTTPLVGQWLIENNAGYVYDSNYVTPGSFYDNYGYCVRVSNNYVTNYFQYASPAFGTVGPYYDTLQPWILYVSLSSVGLPNYLRGVIVGNSDVYILCSTGPTTASLSCYRTTNWYEGCILGKWSYVGSVNITSKIGTSQWNTSQLVIGTILNNACQMLVMSNTNDGFHARIGTHGQQENNSGNGYILQGSNPVNANLRRSVNSTQENIIAFGLPGTMIYSYEDDYLIVLENSLYNNTKTWTYSEMTLNHNILFGVIGGFTCHPYYSPNGSEYSLQLAATYSDPISTNRDNVTTSLIFSYQTINGPKNVITESTTLRIVEVGYPLEPYFFYSMSGYPVLFYFAGVDILDFSYLFNAQPHNIVRLNSAFYRDVYVFSESSLIKNYDLFAYGITKTLAYQSQR